jgi:histidinol-phosphate/aromatic aminotransferase/cobyric acid decarboxylase-like protein
MLGMASCNQWSQVLPSVNSAGKSGPSPTAAELVSACRTDGVFLRDASIMGQAMGNRAVRLAVKPLEQQARILAALQRAL